MSGRGHSESEEKAIYYDPQSQQKITAGWEKFMAAVLAEYPRMGNALKGTRVSGHTLSLTVTTDIIRDELLRNQAEITELLHKHCGIEGSIILDITISASQDDSLPHRTMDKVHFLVERNPELNKLIKEFELDAE